MAINNYTGLIAAIPTDWMHRSDITTAQCDDFIDLFESDFSSNVRTRNMEASTSLTSTAGYLVHPTNWIGWKIIKGTISGYNYTLQNASDEIATERVLGELNATPARYFKVRGDKTWLYPGPSSGVSFAVQYYESVPALSSSAPTNWLLTKYPGAYLFGTLIMSNLMVGDPRYSEWLNAYNTIVERIKADDRKEQWSGQALRMQTDLPRIP